MVKWLKAKYEQLFEDSSGAMMITCGKIHDYLSMQLDFSTPREVKVTMIPYVKEIVTLFEQYDNSMKTVKTPASDIFIQDVRRCEGTSGKASCYFSHFCGEEPFCFEACMARHFCCCGFFVYTS